MKPGVPKIGGGAMPKLGLKPQGESKLKLGGSTMPKIGANKTEQKPMPKLSLNKKEGETKTPGKFNFTSKKDGEDKPALKLGLKDGEKKPLKLNLGKKDGEGKKLLGNFSLGKKAIGGAAFEIKFNFGTGKEFTGTTDPKAPFASGMILNKSNLNRASSSEKQDDGPVDDAESMISKVVDQGEEGEDTLFNEKTKMMIFIKGEGEDKQGRWAERGSGNLHLNKGDGFYRLLLRRAETLKICLNVRLNKSMVFTGMRRDAVTFICPYKFEEQNDAPETITKIVLRFKDEKVRDDFINKVNEIIGGMK